MRDVARKLLGDPPPSHGKVRRGMLRLHYSWSGKAGEPVYVVYVGPKITKR